MNNAMSLKAKIRNIAKSKNIPAQVILQNYMFDIIKHNRPHILSRANAG